MTISIDEIKDYLHKENFEFEYCGDAELRIEGFCPVSAPKSNLLTWIKKMESFDLFKIDKSLKLLIIADKKPSINFDSYNLLITKDPKAAYFDLLNRFFLLPIKPQIAPTAIVETKNIGNNVFIGHNCYIAPDVVIGNNVKINHNVVIECPTVIGDDCVIGSGAVIGTFGYGYYTKDGVSKKVPDFGGVKIGNRVDIGANACIVRGTLGDTIIGDDVKIDNLCHIAHNAIIGNRSKVIALSMIAGSTQIGEDAYVAPGAMIMNQLKVGKNSFVGMGSVVIKDVEDNKAVAGYPARNLREN